jgi:hypothetical protein
MCPFAKAIPVPVMSVGRIRPIHLSTEAIRVTETSLYSIYLILL